MNDVNFDSGLKAAQRAHARKDHEAALWIFSALRRRFPERKDVYLRGAALLREMKHYEDADGWLTDGQNLFPQEPAMLFDYARVAESQRDWPQSLRRWTAAREQSPNHWLGYVGAANALRELKRYDEADALLVQAQELFPQEPSLLFDYARVAEGRRDWPEAVRRWIQVRERSPNHWLGYAGGAAALRELGKFDEAESLLIEGQARFPSEASMYLEYAHIADLRKDWAEALSRWSSARQRFPNHLLIFLRLAAALRELERTDEADSVLAEAQAVFPQEQVIFVEHARASQNRKDWAEAVRRWNIVAQKFPECAEAYISSARALKELLRDDEASAILLEGQKHLPGNFPIAADLAWKSFFKEDWTTAEERFASIRERFPAEPVGYTGGAAALARQGRVAEAEILLETGLSALPNSVEVAIEQAQLPAAGFLGPKRDWSKAIERLEKLCARFPTSEAAHSTTARILREAGRLSDAERFVADARSRMPDSQWLAIEYAYIAMGNSDFEAAIERFTQARDRFPFLRASYVGLADILSRRGRFEEAESVLSVAMEKFPTDAGPFDQYAMVARRKNDLKAALERWIEARDRFPNEKHLVHRVQEAQLQLIGLGEEVSVSIDPEVMNESASMGEASLSQVIQAFESLGGYYLGCEFGLVQRALGAEPIGLLRWSNMEPENIIAALEAEFEGVGLPENTELIVPAEHGGNDYSTRDRRFNMQMHTFIARDDAPPDRVFNQTCRRLQFLKKKLLEDLRSNFKIFVFKCSKFNLTKSQVQRLYAAMRSFGDNTLLYVRYSDAEHPNGTVEVEAPGLLIGYIDRFAVGPSGETLGPNTDSWVDICQKAYQIWRQKTTAAT